MENQNNILQQNLLGVLQHVPSANFAAAASSVKLYQYKREPEKDLAPGSVPLLSVYENQQTFIIALENGDPACLVAAVDLMALINPVAVEQFAIESLEQKRWRTLDNALRKLLGNCESEASFLALVKENPFGSSDLRRNRFPGACCYIEQFLQSDSIVHSFTPFHQPTFQEWNEKSSDLQNSWSAEAKRQDAIYNFDDVNLRETFLLYIGEHQCSVDTNWLHTLWTTHPAKKIRLGAGHALLRRLKGSKLSRLSDHIFCIDFPIYTIAFFALMLEEPKTAASRLKSKMQAIDFDCYAEKNSKFLNELLNTLWGRHLDTKENPWLLQDEDWIDVLLNVKAIPKRNLDAMELLEKFPAGLVESHQSRITNFPIIK